MRAFLGLKIGFFLGCILPGYLAKAETEPWIESGTDKAVIARHSKSPDGRHALAWVVAEPASVDWSLLKSDPDSFYEKYELREFWVVDLLQGKKLCSLGSSVGYVRPGSHRSLNVAWGPLEGGRRFAVAAYDWKWGTDALIVLDLGSDSCREAQVSPVVDRAVNAFVKKDKAQPGTYDIKYLIAELPELGLKTGFSNVSTTRIPFTVKIRGSDRPVAEGIVTLNLRRRADTPSVTVTRTTADASRDDPFSDDARLAKADRDLNAVYLGLLKHLDAGAQESLRTEERNWVDQREKQAADTKADYSENSRIIRDRSLRRLTEERTAELRKRADSIGKK